MKKMNKFMSRFLAIATLTIGAGFASSALAAGGEAEAEKQSWSFAGLFGTYDEHQLQRGFQVYREVCSNCHGAELIAFRNLSEEGGPGFSEEQVKLLASEYLVQDPDAVDGERPAVAADRWPSPFLTEQDARDANGGAVPPDFSVLAKARNVNTPFPGWILNYFTAYQEGGPDYIYNLLVSYEEEPHDIEVPDGKSYYAYPGISLSMAPPLVDGLIDYEGDAFPETTEQYAKDVSAFMMWMADPHLPSRKAAGFRVLIFLVLLAGLMYLVKRKLFDNVAH